MSKEHGGLQEQEGHSLNTGFSPNHAMRADSALET